MKTFALACSLAIGCGASASRAPSAAAGSAAGSGSATPIAAAVADAPNPEPIDEDKLLDVEAIGPLRWNMTAEQLVQALGAPRSKSAPQVEEATGQYVSHWRWPGVEIEMAADTPKGAFRARMITLREARDFATTRGIRVGSTLADVQRVYPPSPDGAPSPGEFLVGSTYGGLLFTLKDDVVTEIALGPFGF